jgi:hypothetical protein
MVHLLQTPKKLRHHPQCRKVLLASYVASVEFFQSLVVPLRQPFQSLSSPDKRVCIVEIMKALQGASGNRLELHHCLLWNAVFRGGNLRSNAAGAGHGE